METPRPRWGHESPQRVDERHELQRLPAAHDCRVDRALMKPVLVVVRRFPQAPCLQGLLGNPSGFRVCTETFYVHPLARSQCVGRHGSPNAGGPDDQKKARESGRRFAFLPPLKPQSRCTSGCSHPSLPSSRPPADREVAGMGCSLEPAGPSEQPTAVGCQTTWLRA